MDKSAKVLNINDSRIDSHMLDHHMQQSNHFHTFL